MCCSPFYNDDDSNATEVEKRGQISHSFTPIKIAEGWAKCLSQFFTSDLEPDLVYTFDGNLSGGLED